MTTNIGAEVKSDGLGFQPTGRAGETEKALRQRFAPEFLGRLDRIVCFKSLEKPMLEMIADKYIEKLCKRAESNGIRLSLPERLPEELMKFAEKKDGARRIRRLVEEWVEGPLSEYLLRCPKKPSKVVGRLEEGKLRFFD